MLCILCQFNIKCIKIKSRISKVYAFFHKKKSSLQFNDTFFCKRPSLIYFCMLGNRSRFYFCLLTFFEIKFLQINYLGPPSECQIVWTQIKTDILLVFILVQTVCKGYWQTTKFLAGMKRVITGKCFSVQYIGSFQLVHTHDTCICIPLIILFDMLSFKYSKDLVRISFSFQC